MSFFEHNDEDVERFIDALRCNPHAVPPEHLDDETIGVIRQLVEFYSPPLAAEDDCLLSESELWNEECAAASEQRVWDRVVFATFAPPDIHLSYLSRSAKLNAEADRDGDEEAEYGEVAAVVSAAVLPVRSSLPVVYHRQKLDLSFVAVMVFAVFFFTGLLLQQDTLESDQRRFGSPSKAEMSIPELDTEWLTTNPELFIRYQPTGTLSERLPAYSQPEEVKITSQNSLYIPISYNKHYPE